MRSLVVASLIAASVSTFVVPAFVMSAGAQTTRMHSARVMMRHVGTGKTAHYEVMMNGTTYSMIPKVDYDHLLDMCKQEQSC